MSTTEQWLADDQQRLAAYLNDRLQPTDWHTTPAAVRETWLEALKTGGLVEDAEDEETGLPLALLAAARRVVRRRTHPAGAEDVQWHLLTQVLGHVSQWPARWHDVLETHGQHELLRVYVAELEKEAEAELEVTRAAARVVPLPSAMPAHRPAAAAA